MATGRRLSLRLRITAGALIVVIAVATAGGLLFIRVVEHEMVAQVDSTLSANADFIDDSLRSGSPLPTGRGPADLLVQFLTPDGTVAGASTAASGVPPLGKPADGSRHITGVHRAALGDLRVLTEPSPVDERMTIVVARSAESVGDVRSLLARGLAAAVVAGSVLLAVLIWVVVGRALRPVESMRRTAQAISERNLDVRLDRPRTSDELQRLADTLNELLDRLERALTRERRFVADASHELRSPIAGIRALLETEPADPAQVVEVRAEALARLGRLEDLVERLLVLARNEAPVRAADTHLVDLDDLVLGQARQLGRTTNLRIDTAEVSAGQVVGDDTDLGRVVENLAVNAARHARTSVAFSLHETDGVVELAVTDDGPGIAAADRVRVFDRFTTLDDARALPDGRTGLGLAIASAIVTGHGGSIHAEEGTHAGARMVVRLPGAAISEVTEAST